MEKQKNLIKINNQCAAVQESISKHYENPDNRELFAELTKLKQLLDEYFGNEE